MKKASDLRIPFKWQDRKSVFLEKCLYIPGHFDRHDEWEIVPFSDASFFGNEKPVRVEYCSGNGQWIVEMAKKNPEINWVAVEMKFERARKIWGKIFREDLSNLFVVCSEALIFTKYYMPKKSVSGVYVNFPDPWPKLRHAKNRLIQDAFLKEVELTLKEGAIVWMTTDDEMYRDQMIAVSMDRPLWGSKYSDPFYVRDLEGFEDSYFKNLWEGKGKSIYHMAFEVKS